MTTILPISSDLSLTNEVIVEWAIPLYDGTITTIRESLWLEEAVAPVYSCAFLSCSHPTGKWWETMYISINRASNVGISITAWGKKTGARGSIQVKQVPETEWYDVVKTKLDVKKGYQALSFIGRKEGLTVPQSRTFRPALENVPYSPQIAIDTSTASAIIARNTTHGLGVILAQTLSMHAPTRGFFTKLALNGHNLEGHLADIDVEMIETANKDLIRGLITGLDEYAEPIPRVVVPKEPEIDRSEVYGAWGAFG